jgi:hypothetical protein
MFQPLHTVILVKHAHIMNTVKPRKHHNQQFLPAGHCSADSRAQLQQVLERCLGQSGDHVGKFTCILERGFRYSGTALLEV